MVEARSRKKVGNSFYFDEVGNYFIPSTFESRER
jgi:hypothetical protein